MVYCINDWPLEAIAGAGTYGVGSANQNEIIVHEISLGRDGHNLFVNNHLLRPEETYDTTHWALSVNPWVLYTRRFVIKNEGPLTYTEASTSTDALYVSGDVYEGWFINPLGPIILGYGIWLFVQERKRQNRISSTMVEAG